MCGVGHYPPRCLTVPVPNLSDYDDRIDAAAMDYLGELITYTPSGSLASPIRAHVDYQDVNREIAGAAIVDQDMQVAIRITDVPAKPNSSDRVVLPKRPGKTYYPVNVGLDRSGTHYEFELKEVA